MPNILNSLASSEWKILVPLDGTTSAEAALPVAASLAQQMEAQILLLHSLEVFKRSTIHGQKHLSDAAQAHNYLNKIAAKLQQSGVRAFTHVHQEEVSDVADTIVEHAAENRSTMIVMSTHGAGIFHRFLGGNLAQQSLKQGAFPVILVPEDYRPPAEKYRVRKILLACDGIHDCSEALTFSISFALAYSSEIHLVMVVPTMKSTDHIEGATGILSPSATKAALDYSAEDSQLLLDNLTNQLKDEYPTVITHTLRGEVAACLNNYAEANDIDLVVISSHGQSGIRAFLEGSYGQKIIKSIKRPMLLLKSQAPHDEKW